MKGKGMPAKGNMPVIDPIFTNAWSTIHRVIPMSANLANGSPILFATIKLLHANRRNKRMRNAAPKNPVSSANTAKMESEMGSGSTPNFWNDKPNPTPINPPEPIPMSACFIWYPLPRGSSMGSKNTASLLRRYGAKRIKSKRTKEYPPVSALHLSSYKRKEHQE